MKAAFHQLTNFRDLGGIHAGGGRVVRPGRLLRSGDLHNLPEHDRHLLQDTFGLRRVIDLRTAEEQKKRPDIEIPGAHHTAIDLTLGARELTVMRGAPDTIKTADEMLEWMLQSYRDMVCPQVAAAYRAVFDVLLDTSAGAVLFHCFAGKDRTGMVAAVILTALGADRQAIMADYLETNRLREAANNQLFEQGNWGAVQSREAFDIAMTVQQRFLEHAWETAEKLYGSWEEYIHKAIGITEEETATLRSRYLAGPNGK